MSEVKDITEITWLLHSTVNQQNNDKDKKERKQENLYHIDSIDISKMNELINTYVKINQHDKDKGLHKSSENFKLEHVKNISEVKKKKIIKVIQVIVIMNTMIIMINFLEIKVQTKEILVQKIVALKGLLQNGSKEI